MSAKFLASTFNLVNENLITGFLRFNFGIFSVFYGDFCN